MRRELTLKLRWPETFAAFIDLSQMPAMTSARGPFGQVVFRLPSPFSDVTVEDGEHLTVEKAARLLAAAATFGITPSRKERSNG